MGILDRVEPPLAADADPWRRVEVVAARPGPEFEAVIGLRRRVFGREQGMVDGRVTDKDDARSLNALALRPAADGPTPVGTGRLTLDYGEQREALIAWVATAPEARERGVGSAIMCFLLAAADQAAAARVVLAAQVQAQSFYRRLGFVGAGQPYLVRGVPHRWMARTRESSG